MKLYLNKTDERGDKRLSLFICTYILSSSLNISVKTILPVSGSAWTIISYSFEAVIILALLIALPDLVFRERFSFIFTELFFGVLYVYSILLGEADRSLLQSTAFWTLAVCIPLGIAGVAVYDKGILFRYLRITSFIEYPVLCIALLSMRNVASYNMSASYAIILPILLLLHSFVEKRNYMYAFWGMIGVVLVLMYGARGPFVCIAFYAFTIMFFSKRRSFWIIVLRVILIVLMMLIILYWETIIQSIQSTLSRLGIHSYFLQRLINGQILETAGRDELWKYYIDLIRQRPIIGYGLQGGWLASGNGPHNTLLEFLLAFGVVIGSIICLVFLYLFGRAVFYRKGIEGDLILILAAYHFTMLLVSGNWLEKPLFFLFVCLSFSSRYDEKKRNVIENQDMPMNTEKSALI